MASREMAVSPHGFFRETAHLERDEAGGISPAVKGRPAPHAPRLRLGMARWGYRAEDRWPIRARAGGSECLRSTTTSSSSAQASPEPPRPSRSPMPGTTRRSSILTRSIPPDFRAEKLGVPQMDLFEKLGFGELARAVTTPVTRSASRASAIWSRAMPCANTVSITRPSSTTCATPCQPPRPW